MKRTEQATEGLSWEIREREESAWEEERDSISRTSQPASQQGGKGSKEGRKHRSRAKAGSGDRGRRAPQLEVSGLTDGKGWRLGRQAEPGPRARSGGRRQGRDKNK